MMTYEFRNPQYSNADSSSIDVEINHPVYGWIPFTARADDVEPTGREVFEAASAGTVAAFVPPTAEELRAALPALSDRQLRLGLLLGGVSEAAVAAVIDAMPAGLNKEIAKIEWARAGTFDRSHPLIASVSAALGMTAEQVDDLWNTALTL